MASRREINSSDDEGEEQDGPEEGEERGVDDEEDELPRKGRKGSRVTGRTPWQKLKAWFRDFRLYLYAAFFAGSFLLAVLGVLSVWNPRLLGPGVEAWFRSIGSFNSYLFLAGFIFFLAATYLFFGLLSKRAEFKRLVSTKSKVDFVHSLDRIERLAFELGTHENEIVASRKREFRIRH